MGFVYVDQSAAPRSKARIKDALDVLRAGAARRALPDWTRQLATLLQSGTSVPDSLESLATALPRGPMQRATRALELATKRGRPLHAAMRDQPRLFDRVFVEIVAAGERAGTLERMLDPLAEGLLADRRVRGRVSRAMVYPVFSLVASLGGGYYLLRSVIPSFADLYVRQGVTLPPLTRALLTLSDALAAGGSVAPALLAALVLALPRLLAVETVALRRDALLLRLPIVGSLARERAAAAFLRFLGLLLATQAVPEAEAVRLAARTAPNRALAARLASAAADVATGTARLPEALARQAALPPLVLQVLVTGERAGRLPKVVAYAAGRMEERVLERIERAQALAEPAALLVVFGVVAVLMLGIYAPMAGIYEVLAR